MQQQRQLLIQDKEADDEYRRRFERDVAIWTGLSCAIGTFGALLYLFVAKEGPWAEDDGAAGPGQSTGAASGGDGSGSAVSTTIGLFVFAGILLLIATVFAGWKTRKEIKKWRRPESNADFERPSWNQTEFDRRKQELEDKKQRTLEWLSKERDAEEEEVDALLEDVDDEVKLMQTDVFGREEEDVPQDVLDRRAMRYAAG